MVSHRLLNNERETIYLGWKIKLSPSRVFLNIEQEEMKMTMRSEYLSEWDTEYFFITTCFQKGNCDGY